MKIHRTIIVTALALLLWLVALPVAADSGGIALVGQSIALESGRSVNGDVALVAGSIVIARDVHVRGDLAVIGGSAQVNGTIEGDAFVLGGSMVLGPDAWIKGDVIALGALTRDPDARIDGNVTAGADRTERLQEVRRTLQDQITVPEASQRPALPDPTTLRMWNQLRWVAGVLGVILLAAIVVSILPEAMPHVSTVMGRSVLLSTAVGFVTLLGAGVLMPLLTITIIGIPVALVIGVGLLLAGLCGWVAAALLVGRKILGLLNTSSPNTVVHAAVGVVALALVGRVPCLGALFTLAVICWGLGGIVLTRFGTSPTLIWSPFEPMAPGATGQPARLDQETVSVQRTSDEPHRSSTDSGGSQRDDAGTRRL